MDPQAEPKGSGFGGVLPKGSSELTRRERGLKKRAKRRDKVETAKEAIERHGCDALAVAGPGRQASQQDFQILTGGKAEPKGPAHVVCGDLRLMAQPGGQFPADLVAGTEIQASPEPAIGGSCRAPEFRGQPQFPADRFTRGQKILIPTVRAAQRCAQDIFPSGLLEDIQFVRELRSARRQFPVFLHHGLAKLPGADHPAPRHPVELLALFLGFVLRQPGEIAEPKGPAHVVCAGTGGARNRIRP